MAGHFDAPSHPGVLKKINMNGNILLKRISWCANNCGQHELENYICLIMTFSLHFQLFYFNDRLDILYIF